MDHMICQDDSMELFACRACGFNTKSPASILYHIAYARRECQPPAYLKEPPSSHGFMGRVRSMLRWKGDHL